MTHIKIWPIKQLAFYLTLLSSLFILPFSISAEELPEAPSINRDVHLSEKGVTTRPYIPAYRTSNDGRVGITRRTIRSGRHGFFLFVPEKYNAEEGASFHDNPDGLNGKNGLSILSTRAGDNGDVMNGIEPALFDIGNQHGMVPRSRGWINRGHNTICDAGGARNARELGGQNRNPYTCGVDDCYDLKVIGYAFNLESRERKLFGTPLTVRVANPKTKSAYIKDIHIPRDNEGEPLTEFSQAEFNIVNLFEPQFTSDGKLLVARVGNSRVSWEKEYGPNPGPRVTGTDVAYFRNSKGVGVGVACDIKDFDNLYPITYAQSDLTVKQRYGFAKYPFRDSMNNPIRDDSDLRSYPWIDKDGNNLSFATYRHGLFGRQPDGTFDSEHPARCLSDLDTECFVERNGIGGGPKGQAIMGLWTHGKTVLLDGLVNNTDYHSGRYDFQQREIQLYQATEQWDGWVRTGNGGSNQLGSFVPQLYPTNTGFFETNESAFHYLKHMKPTRASEVSWIVSSGAVTEELSFDDYLNLNGFIMSNMMPAIRHHGSWTPYTGHGGRTQPLLQNHATALPSFWQIPSHGTVVNARIEPVATGGIVGRGLWLSGEDSRVEYEIPMQRHRMSRQTWNIGLFLDPRFSKTTADRSGRQLLGFPDGSSLWLMGRFALQFRQGTNVVHNITTSRKNAHGRMLKHIEYNAWNHLGLQISNNGSTIRTFIDGLEADRLDLPLGQRLFGLSGNTNDRGGGVLTLGAENGNPGFRGWVDEFKIIAGPMNLEGSCNLAHGTIKGMYRNHGAVGEELDNLMENWRKAREQPPFARQRLNECVASTGRPIFERYSCDVDYGNDRFEAARDTAGMTSVRKAINFPEGPFFADEKRPDARTNRFCLSCHRGYQPAGLSMRGLVAGSLQLRPPALPEQKVIGHSLLGALDLEGELHNLESYLDRDGFNVDRLIFKDSERFYPTGDYSTCFE